MQSNLTTKTCTTLWSMFLQKANSHKFSKDSEQSSWISLAFLVTSAGVAKKAICKHNISNMSANDEI